MSKKPDFKEVLQAIIVADSFNSRFAPLTQTKPRALLPLVNVPLLDYTLEFLAANGVHEAYVLCCSHADQIQEHINVINTTGVGQRMKITTCHTAESLSVGDAMREIHRMGVINSHFILVTGDLVSNFQLGPLLQEHKARYKANNNAFITMLFQECQPNHHLRTGEEDIAIAVESKTDRLLHYSQSDTDINIPISLLVERNTLKLRYDLLNCHTAICAPVIPALFEDNFDYQSMDDLITQTLEGDGISSGQIFMHCLKNSYAARASNLTSYAAISKDILRRWTYPLVPDVFALDHPPARRKGKHIYLQPKVVLSRACVLERDVAVGDSCQIGHDGQAETRVRGSVIGARTRIGHGCMLVDSFVQSDVTIGNNCTLTKVILGQSVTLLDNVVVEPGCVIGDEVTLGPNITIPAHTKISRSLPEVDAWSDDETETEVLKTPEGVYDVGLVGAKGQGLLWHDAIDEDDAHEAKYRQWIDYRPSLIAEEAAAADESDDDDFDDEIVEQMPLRDDREEFYEIMVELLCNTLQTDASGALDTTVTADDIALEVTGNRSAMHLSPQEVLVGLAQAFVQAGADKGSDSATAMYFHQGAILLSPIFGNYIGTEADHRTMMTTLEAAFASRPFAQPCFLKLLHTLYDQDVLEEDMLLQWYHDAILQPDADEVHRSLYKQVEKFMDWLEEAESESGDESEE
eukprot:m.80064 g.80064  ORF g.80064 m.80064 type:complete len:690 (+) comp14533_c0_seq2:93-2162(+)